MSQIREVNRRRLLQQLALVTSAGTLEGCSFFVKRPTPVCPDSPDVSLPKGSLTIDAHCHVFNGSDLQINGFIGQVLAKQGGLTGIGARAIAPLLQNIAWKVAPSGSTERKFLGDLANNLKACSAIEHVKQTETMRGAAYFAGQRELKIALNRSSELQEFKGRTNLKQFDFTGDGVSGAQAALILEIEGLPEGLEEYKRLRAPGLKMMAHQRSASGMVDFVLQNFQYRYVSVYDYLGKYDKPGSTRFVDLMLPSMVDYDFWLADGGSPPTNLRSQVEVMETISVVTGGRVHGFVAFDPLREVAFELGKARVDSSTLVKEAIEHHGCVGVKLYPPMGFAAYGNGGLPRDFWHRSWLPEWTSRPDMGDLLDKAMLKMLKWCAANEVPVMAHTGLSNGPSSDFEALASAKYWALALNEVKDLRVSFGHFGDSSLGEIGDVALGHARGFHALMHESRSESGGHAYADAGYFVEGILERPQLMAALQQLYENTLPGQAPLSTRFMYGTDWEMTITEGNDIDSYLEQFVALFDDMERRPAIKSQGVANLANRFFGENAVGWIGLRLGERARDRLEKFYAAKSVTPPDWAKKVDELPR